MQKRTRSLLEELSSMPLKRDKEEVVESRASHDQDTAFKLEKKFNSAIKNMDASKFSKGVARIKENRDVKENLLKIKDGEYKED